ncbi:endonuclease domain-containing protein [Microlunatus soli]|uniref:Very-short-patch-repair endonuclease n=1 Tax=Microlunatus soli TaxID=630515 RepID=A0A1H1X2C1_9ACTN|nr:DUF559 domain-containing protein [Microlunatus soli]SDT03517.1 Very-short-patch-repair endonuclease [Microlunatus soli]
MNADIEEAIRAGGGVVRRRDHPQLIHQLDRLRGSGRLVSLLPGHLCRPEQEKDWNVRVLAGLSWAGPDASLTRYAAARLTFWPECINDQISLVRPGGCPRPQKNWPVMRARVPPEFLARAGGVPKTCPAYTAVELIPDVGGDVIDRALRSRMASLQEMWDAFATMPQRAGNNERRRLLQDSRDRPWSELERAGHRLFRKHHLTGWTTNSPVSTRTRSWSVDVLFRRQRVIVEFDGYDFHSDHDAFELDRRRRNELELAGYLVLNFTWAHVRDDPAWVIGWIRLALEARRTQQH